MGPGIAATLSRAGFVVAGFDADAGRRARAPQGLAQAMDALAALDVPDRSSHPVRIAEDLASCVRGADLVIETVPEDLPLKHRVFAELETLVGTECILASDTSGIPITKIQAPARVPSRIVGMHWSNPPHIIPMIEIIAGEQTAPDVVDRVRQVVLATGHLPITIKRDVAGFVENRVLYAIMRECVDLVEQGVIDPRDLDQCVGWGIGYKLSVVGPMALLDMAGLDIYSAVSSYLNRELCNRADVADYIRARTEAGKLGLKSGAGIYSYEPGEITRLQGERARRLIAARRALQS